MNAIIFKNFTEEDFTWKFDGVPFTFKAGQETYMEEFKAKFFAKHLMDRELNRINKVTNDQTEIIRLTALALPTDAVKVTPAEAIDIEAKKAKKTVKSKKVEEEEFSDLKK
jgi:hypothetical protein